MLIYMYRCVCVHVTHLNERKRIRGYWYVYYPFFFYGLFKFELFICTIDFLIEIFLKIKLMIIFYKNGGFVEIVVL